MKVNVRIPEIGTLTYETDGLDVKNGDRVVVKVRGRDYEGTVTRGAHYYEGECLPIIRMLPALADVVVV